MRRGLFFVDSGAIYEDRYIRVVRTKGHDLSEGFEQAGSIGRRF